MISSKIRFERVLLTVGQALYAERQSSKLSQSFDFRSYTHLDSSVRYRRKLTLAPQI
jgi:hypothetical protein